MFSGWKTRKRCTAFPKLWGHREVCGTMMQLPSLLLQQPRLAEFDPCRLSAYPQPERPQARPNWQGLETGRRSDCTAQAAERAATHQLHSGALQGSQVRVCWCVSTALHTGSFTNCALPRLPRLCLREWAGDRHIRSPLVASIDPWCLRWVCA